jgi:hypothetical protein
VVVVVLPLLELVIEFLGVVDDGSIEEAVELLGVDLVRPLHFVVEAGGPRIGVFVPDPFIEHVVMERRAEFGPVVGLDDLDHEWPSAHALAGELNEFLTGPTRQKGGRFE